MSIRAARERARCERPQVTRPTLVLPGSAHPAFQMLGSHARRERFRRPRLATPL